jgi:hypothetical protein
MFETTPSGSAYPILAHQWMAATLSGLAGADTSAVTAELATVQALLEMYDGNPKSAADITKDVKKQFTAVAEKLDAYNNGLIGPGHCD